MVIMGTITVSVDDEVEREFRRLVEDYKGGKKGDLGRAITEAMKKWAEEKKQGEIALHLKQMSEKGLYRLPKGWKLNREELYDRR